MKIFSSEDIQWLEKLAIKWRPACCEEMSEEFNARHQAVMIRLEEHFSGPKIQPMTVTLGELNKIARVSQEGTLELLQSIVALAGSRVEIAAEFRKRFAEELATAKEDHTAAKTHARQAIIATGLKLEAHDIERAADRSESVVLAQKRIDEVRNWTSAMNANHPVAEDIVRFRDSMAGKLRAWISDVLTVSVRPDPSPQDHLCESVWRVHNLQDGTVKEIPASVIH